MNRLRDVRLPRLVELLRWNPDDELEGALQRIFVCPPDDELLGLPVEIPFMKRRGIERVEELPEVADPDVDDLWIGHGSLRR